MPDARVPAHRRHGWGDAFAALPPDMPPADGWQRLVARLPAPAPVPLRGPSWRRPAFAVAATVALAVVVPVSLWRAQQTVVVSALPVAQPASPMPGTTATDTAPAVADTPRAIAATTAAQANEEPAIGGGGSTSARAPDTDALDALYAESAQLEAMLAQLPDGGAQNATALALTAELHDQVAYIDAALSQSTLDGDIRNRLWHERVDRLRQLTGVRATPHWQVAQAALLPASDTTIY